MSLPADMSLTRLDEKWRVVIPKEVRVAAGLTVGTKLLVFSTGEGIVLREAEKVLKEVWP